MASADATITTTSDDNHGEAIAKAVKLRALHAALLHSSSPSSAFGASPASRPLPNLSAQDYPVFTPSYEDEPSPAFHQKNPKLYESWDDCVGCLEEEEDDGEQENFRNNFLSDSYKASASRNNTTHPDLPSHIFPLTEDLRSPQECSYAWGRRNCTSGDVRSVSSCNRCIPAVVAGGFDTQSMKNSNIVVPLTDIHSAAIFPQPRNRGGVISWLFPKLKKKQKNNGSIIFNSPNKTDKSEEVSQVMKDSMGIMSIEKLKRELMEANRSRDAALTEVSQMKSTLGELSQKLEYLENYCESLKKALRQATASRESVGSDKFSSGLKESINGTSENWGMPVSEDVMIEGFLQIVSEARLSVKQFLKTLISQIDEDDSTLVGNIDSLLQFYKLSFRSKHSKTVQYHMEAIINQSIYQDFENSVFQKNGTPKFLDPEQDRQAQFSSFVALRNLSWNEVLKKGTKYYSEEFSRFCDQRMSLIITTLNWNRPWSEQLLQAFFVAAKCIWLLHLLAFSFNPPLGILRVEENRAFETNYMEDMAADRRRSSSCGSARVKVMVMPGFYVQDRVLRCKVLCSYKSGT